MRQKILELARGLESSIQTFGTIEGVLVLDSDLDQYDPYFVILIDVYVRGPLAGPAKRQEVFSKAGAFEGNERKDRFMMSDLPIHIEYKDAERFDAITDGHMEAFIEQSYALRRLMTGMVLSDTKGYIQGLRNTLQEIPPGFWEKMSRRFCSKLEHYLEDMLAASGRNDKLHFILAKAGLLESAVAALCALNHAFVPSHRQMGEMLHGIPRVPDGFIPKFDTLVSWDAEPMNRQAELASLLVKKILSISVEL